MATFKAAKVVAALPGTLEPNTAYFLRAGAGFDLYCSDSTGTIAHKLNVPEELNLISQAEAEAGVATTLRAWTSQRVRQAIAGWWAGVTLTKAMVGLSAADNTADSAKNVLSATKLTTPRTINGVSFDGTANITINAVDSTARLAASEKGAANGVVPLVNSLIPAQYLPSFVDDVLEYANLAAFPATGEQGKIYIALDTERTYRWTGSAYVWINSSVGRADTADTLMTARLIGGVSFDGSANINLPGVNTAGNQNTTGTAAAWTTARTLSLTGDATGSGNIKGDANVSFALTLANTAVTAGNYGPAANATLTFGGTFTVPYYTVNSKGQLTAGATRTFTMPAAPTLGDLGGQAALVSGTNIKTVNGNSLLGSGNLVISGGASPGGSDRQIQYKDGTGLGGASSAWIDGSGELVLGAVEDPPAPDTAGLLLFGRQVTSRYMPGFVGPKGLTTVVQPHISRNFVGSVQAQGNGTVLSSTGLTLTAVGTATAANVATTNIHTQSKRLGYHVTTAAISAIAGCRGAASQFFTGTPGSGRGGFHFLCRFGPSLSSAAMTKKRIFCGLYSSTSNPTDTNPSGLSNIIGVGCDSGDANFQLMTRAGSGSATKVDTGISKSATVATEVYEVGVFAPPGASTVYIELRRLSDGLTFGQEISTTLPSATTLLNTYLWMSAGGTSSTVGVALLSMYIETDT